MNARQIIAAGVTAGFFAIAMAARPPVAAAQAGPVRPELAIARASEGDVLEVRYFVDKEVFSNPPEALPLEPNEPRPPRRRGAPGAQVTYAVETRVMTLQLKQVVARRVDGRAVTSQALAAELADEKPVLLITRGQQIDSVLLEMFKPETLVLERPAPQPVPANPAAPIRNGQKPLTPPARSRRRCPATHLLLPFRDCLHPDRQSSAGKKTCGV